jgi:hypothetical protein
MALVVILSAADLAPSALRDGGERLRAAGRVVTGPPSMVGTLRIDLVYPERRRTETPPGWIAYDGARYEPGRGFGWTEDLAPDSGFDRGEDATIVLPTGAKTSPRLLGRRELAHWQGTHRENRPLVFRIDLRDGWYRVTCTSVDPGAVLPLVDARGFKCRAHEAVFAGPRHGRPLVASGMALVEGTDAVEVTGGHLRIVVGDPAYPGWTWRHGGAWYEDWGAWFGRRGGHRYAERWHQKLTRTVDPGFHSLRLNSLVIEPVAAPAEPASLVFRDVFNRDDDPDINRGVPEAARWTPVALEPGAPAIDARLSATSLALTAASGSAVAFVQPGPSPARGRIRYRTRVSVFTGEGSRAPSGVQEAGVLLLGEPGAPADTRATFVGVTVAAGGGGLTVRVGDGAGGYRADVTVGARHLPFEVGAGEYQLDVEHDVARRMLSRIAVNDVDVTSLVPVEARRQRLDRGVFGIRAAMDPGASAVVLRQSYWVYRVDCRGPEGAAC